MLVEKLGQSAIDLRVYFWYDTQAHNGLKLKSSLLRLAKHALDEGGFTVPDTAREVLFPRGAPVRILDPLPVMDPALFTAPAAPLATAV